MKWKILLILIVALFIWTTRRGEQDRSYSMKKKVIPTIIPKKCDKRKIVFIKTHKTGGSTVFNILARLAIKRGYTVACPRYGATRFMWPKIFRTSYVSFHKGQPDILISHSRFNLKEMHKLFPPMETFYLTILRKAAPQWLSTLLYFDIKRNLTKNVHNLVHLIRKLSRDKTYNKLVKSSSYYNLLRNPNLFDLGFNVKKTTMGFIPKHHITKIKNNFDLVMFAERFDESLLILKEMLCLDDEDILYFKLNENILSKKDVIDSFLKNGKIERMITTLNKEDTQLYDKLLSKTKKYFYSISHKLVEFRRLLKENDNTCVKERVNEIAFEDVSYNGYLLKEDLSLSDSKNCKYMSWNELKYFDYFCKAPKYLKPSDQKMNLNNK